MSCELLRDVTDGQGRMFRWTLDAVALLGVHRPAVDSVSNLAALIASRPRPQLTFASRREYSMADEGAAAAELLELRETLRATQREAVQLFLSNSVAQHRVLPRDVHTFERLFPNGGDIQSAQRFVQQTPCPSPDRMRVTTLEHVHHDGVVVETRPRVAAEHFSRAVDGGREMFTTHGRAALPSEVPREADGSIPVWYKIEQARINQFRADPGAGERWKFESGEK
jgi:hypothetical protein